MAVVVERSYPQQNNPEDVKKLAQVLLKIGQRILREEQPNKGRETPYSITA